MKILFLPAYFYPERMASSKLDYDRDVAFSKSGIRMECFTPTPTRGISDAEYRQYKSIPDEYLYDSMMHVHRYHMFREGKNPIVRAFRYLLCLLKQCYWGLRVKDIDCIYLGSTPPINGLIGGFLKKMKRVPFIYNLQDVFPDSLATLGVSQNSLIWKVGSCVERYTYKHADKIIVISEDIKNNIIRKGVPENKIEVVYNWINEEQIHPINKEENTLFDEFGISREKFHVVYAGNLGHAQNIQILIDAAEKLKDNKNIEFLIFGTGGLESEIKEQIASLALDNVRVLPLQPYEKVASVYSLGDVCVVSCKKGLGGSAMPSKSVTIMATGRPLLVNFDRGELEEIVTKNKCGLFSESGNLDEFVDCILKFYNDKAMCEEYGENARNLVLKKFTRDINVAKYVDVVKSFERVKEQF